MFFNYFFGHGFSLNNNLGVCKSELTVRVEVPFSRKKRVLMLVI